MRFLFYISKKYSIPIVQPIIKYFQQTDYIVQCFIFPDEGEVEALAKAGLRVLTDVEKLKIIRFPFMKICCFSFLRNRNDGLTLTLIKKQKKVHQNSKYIIDNFSSEIIVKRFNNEFFS
ncbi:MAG TPA: hypothetical protein ENK03_02885 [Candidatus Cloacimonetes bacterium]|nr:hypothetical protein [Candidatus Cloacimonadota bacterium]